MKPETLTALQGSIEKWEKIVAGTGVDGGASNCALCQRFDQDGLECIRVGNHGDNESCPVLLHIGSPGCQGTPYFDWHDTHASGRFPMSNTTPEHTAAAQKELDFLRSLLPDAPRVGNHLEEK